MKDERELKDRLESLVSNVLLNLVSLKESARAKYYSLRGISYHWADDPIFPDYVVKDEK